MKKQAISAKTTKKPNWLVKIWNYFSTYEKVWFISVAVLAVVIAIISPTEDVGGINGGLILTLYLLNIFLDLMCELLISKQSKWNFILSLLVEVTEISICIVCAYRFASMAVTLLFWIPIDIVSFIAWNKHKDKEDEELTVVRKLTGWQEVLVIFAIVLWTVGVGYLLTLIPIEHSIVEYSIIPNIELATKICCYLDACASAVGIANGLFILFRLREQWIVWYINAFLEMAINIICAQWLLIVLDVGYLTNTTYGYIKWTKYINSHKN